MPVSIFLSLSFYRQHRIRGLPFQVLFIYPSGFDPHVSHESNRVGRHLYGVGATKRRRYFLGLM